MMKRLGILILLMGFVSGITFMSGCYSGESIGSTGGLKGVVVQQDGTTPVAGAEVSFTSGTWVTTATTDTNGNFVIKLPAGKTYSVTAKYPGYQSGTKVSDKVIANQIKDVGVIQLKALGKLIGNVKASDGSPAAGATVEVKDGNGNAVASGTTDGNGNINITGIPEGTYTIVITGTNGESVTIPNVVISGNATTNISDVRTTSATNKLTVNGTVKKTSDGSAIGKTGGIEFKESSSGTVVHTYNIDLSAGTGFVLQGETGVVSGTYDVKITADGFYPITIFEQKIYSNNFTLPAVSLTSTSGTDKTGTLKGKLELDSGSGVGGVYITIFKKNSGEAEANEITAIDQGVTIYASAASLASGVFNIPNIPVGDYYVQFRGPSIQPFQISVEIREGIALDLGIVIVSANYGIRGKIKDQFGNYANGVTVILKKTNGDVFGTTLTNSSGEFSFESVTPSTSSSTVKYQIEAAKSTSGEDIGFDYKVFNNNGDYYQVGIVKTVVFTEAGILTLNRSVGTVTATLLDTQKSDSPAAGVVVKLMSGTTVIDTKTTGSDGKVSFEKLNISGSSFVESGKNYNVQVDAQGVYLSLSLTGGSLATYPSAGLSLTAGLDRKTGTLSGSGIQVNAKDTSGNTANVTAGSGTVHIVNTELGIDITVPIQSDGTISVPDLPYGSGYTITLTYSSDYDPIGANNVTIDGANEDLAVLLGAALVFQPAGSATTGISLTVNGDSGPLSGITVVFTNNATGETVSRTTGSDGKVDTGAVLPLGEYTITINSESSQSDANLSWQYQTQTTSVYAGVVGQSVIVTTPITLTRESTGSLVLTVKELDASGAEYALSNGASVTLNGTTSASGTTVGGAVSFSSLKYDSNYTVTVSKSGFTTITNLTVGKIEGNKAMTVLLSPDMVGTYGGGSVYKISISITGGASNTTTLVLKKDGAAVASNVLASGVSSYDFTSLLPGNYTVTAEKADYNAITTEVIKIVNANQSKTIAFDDNGTGGTTAGSIKRATVAVTVQRLDGDGNLLGAGIGASVTLGGVSGTESNGVYTFSNVKYGQGSLSVALSGYQPAPYTETLTIETASVSTTVGLTNGAAYTISGTISGGEANATTLVVKKAGVVKKTVTVSATGAYTISGITSGSGYTVTAQKAYYNDIESGSFNITTANAAGIDFAYADSGSGAGTIKTASVVITVNKQDSAGNNLGTVGSTGTVTISGYTAVSIASGTATISGVKYGTGQSFTVSGITGFNNGSGVVDVTGASVSKTVTLSPTTRTISGTISNNADSPNTVLILKKSGIEVARQTVSSPSYSFTNLGAYADYTVTAQKTYYNDLTTAAIDTRNANASISQITFADSGTGSGAGERKVGTLSGSVSLNDPAGETGSIILSYVSGPKTFSSQTLTAPTGSFSLTGLYEGTYTVKATRSNYLDKTITVTVVGATSAGTMSLDPNYGTVLFNISAVNPIAGDTAGGAAVTFNGRSYTAVTSGSNGTLSLGLSEKIKAGSYSYSISKALFEAGVNTSGTLSVTAGNQTTVDATLNAYAQIIGTLKTGAIATITPGSVSQTSNVSLRVTAGTYSIAITNMGFGYDNLSASKTLVAGEIWNLNTGWTGTGGTDVNGGVNVTPYTISVSVTGPATYTVDVPGAVKTSATSFTVARNTAYTVSLTGLPTGYTNKSQSVTSSNDPANKNKAVSFTLSPAQIRLTADMADTQFKVYDNANILVATYNQVELDKTYAINPGTYRVDALKTGFVITGATPAQGTFQTIAEGVTKQFSYNLQSYGTVTGTVKDSANGDIPLADALLAFTGPESKQVYSNGAGQFTLNLKPGFYTYTVSKAGYSTKNGTISITGGGTQDLTAYLNMAGIGYVTGQVVSWANSATVIPNATVKLYEGGVLKTSVTTDSQGRFTMSADVSNSYSINVDGLTVNGVIYTNGTKSNIRVNLSQTTDIGKIYMPVNTGWTPGYLSGTVIDAVRGNNTKIANATVEVRIGGSDGPIATFVNTTTEATGTTASNGTFTIGNSSNALLSGQRYTVVIRASNYTAAVIDVNVNGDTSMGIVGLSPLVAQGELRITLRWQSDGYNYGSGVECETGSSCYSSWTSDLDGHLVGPSGSNFHVWYGKRDNRPNAYQDQDDTVNCTKNGETITIYAANTLPNGVYSYTVHNYAKSTSTNYLSANSNAVVLVYDSRGILSTVEIEPNAKWASNGWKVFELDKVSNTYSVRVFNQARNITTWSGDGSGVRSTGMTYEENILSESISTTPKQ